MKTSNKHINRKVFYSLCKEYNLSIVKQTDLIINALIPSKYVIGGFILEYNIITDSLYIPANIDRTDFKIYLYSVIQYSPKLFKMMVKKFIRLEKELKEIEVKQRQNRLQSDF